MQVRKLGVRNRRALAWAVLLFAPLHVFVFVGAALLRTPVVPVLGLPLFIIASPRPLRFWRYVH